MRGHITNNSSVDAAINLYLSVNILQTEDYSAKG